MSAGRGGSQSRVREAWSVLRDLAWSVTGRPYTSGKWQHEGLRHTSASLLACKAAGWVATRTLTPAPYRPVPRSHWGHCPGSGMSPGGAQTETFVSCSSSQPLLWQLPSSTSDPRDGMPGNEGVEVPPGAQSALVTVLQAPLHSFGTAFCQNSTMALSGVLG